MNSKEKLFEDWVKNILNKKGDGLKKERWYAHFDKIIKTKRELLDLKTIFLDPILIKSRNFLPFIHYNKKERKYIWRLVKNRTSKKKERWWEKNRSILYASHKDSLLYSWYAFQLNTHYEAFLSQNKLDSCIGAYRLNTWVRRSNITLADETFREIKKRQDCAVLTFDISKFYDSLDKKILKQQWSEILGLGRDWLPEDYYAIFKSIFYYSAISKNDLNQFLNLKYHFLPEKVMKDEKRYSGFICHPGDLKEIRKKKLIYTKKKFIEKLKSTYWEEYMHFEEEKWIPQWSPISPVLANIYLAWFDNSINGYISWLWWIYKRYADDILIVCSTEQKEWIEKFIMDKIWEVNLTIQEKKTDWFIFNKGIIVKRKGYEKSNSHRSLQYLWFDFDGTRIYIRWSSVSRYYQKMRKSIMRNLKWAIKKDSKAIEIRIRQVQKNFLVEKFARYTRNSTRILNSPNIERQLRNAGRNILKFQELAEVHILDQKGTLIDFV